MRKPKYLRLAVLYCVWGVAVILALLLGTAYHFDRFNVGWGDSTADQRHAVLWWKMVIAIVVCIGLTILIGLASRLMLFSIVAAGGVLWLSWLGADGPHMFQVFLFVSQIPGIYSSLLAVGVHEGGHLRTLWSVSVNTILYAPLLFYGIARHRRTSHTSTKPA